jgi:hypothetical protein
VQQQGLEARFGRLVSAEIRSTILDIELRIASTAFLSGTPEGIREITQVLQSTGEIPDRLGLYLYILELL